MLLDIKVNIEIITSSNSYLNKEKIPNNIKITIDENDHDRFIIIDDIVYAIGTSFNGIGKGKFVMIKLKNLNKEMILKNKRIEFSFQSLILFSFGSSYRIRTCAYRGQSPGPYRLAKLLEI